MKTTKTSIVPTPFVRCALHASAYAFMALVFIGIFIVGTSISQAQTPRLLFSKKIKTQTTKTYRVQKGDYLYSIIRAQGYPEKLIPTILRQTRALNPSLGPKASIHPGQIIRLYTPPQDVNTPHGSPETTKTHIQETPTEKKLGERYTFRPGDTLFNVLRKKTGLDTQQIIRQYLPTFIGHNPAIKNINQISRGQTVVLPAYPTTKTTTPRPRPFLRTDTSATHSPKHDRLTPAQGKHYTRTFLEAMGFSFTRGKQAFFPRPHAGWLRINLKKTPIAQTPWGASVLLVPKTTLEIPTNNSEQAGLFPCLVPEDWNPHNVIHAIARKFPKKMSLQPYNAPLERRMGNMHVTLKTDVMVNAAWTGTHTTYCLQVIPKNESPYPVLVSSLLQAHDITLMQWLADSNKQLIPVKQQLVQAADIYTPTVSRDSLAMLTTNRNGAPIALPELPPIPESTPQQTSINLHWERGKGHISLSTELMGLKTEDQLVILLDQKIKAPYLVALLGMQGQDCYVLEDPGTQ